ncbi:MAG: tRNA (N6-isopentenyl adenosine(37)-C2)-methylthiotransferase MiaB [Anaerolineaceae bacterium]|nr:tRNA (N6-isopentenyl adenosine(37)-C2)-methylthiotransferase MiaB [Anaerolineaceae bacterium]
MNVADSQRLASSLEKLGYVYSSKIDSADVIILNTCVVRQSAENKAIGRLSSLKPLKEKNPDLVINLMGCLIGIQGNEKIRNRFPWVDVFSPPSDPRPLLDFLSQETGKADAEIWRQDIDGILDEEYTLPLNFQGKLISTNLPIVLGCSHACTYCIIPHKRGREISRPSNEILKEAQKLVSQGVREIVLLGQIVDRYGLDIEGGIHLHELLFELSKIEKLHRIRFLTSHPNWMSDNLIDAVASLPKVMPHIEVPIQAGDDDILLAMRRGYTVEAYHKLIQKLRERIPGVSIGTDIIVGFSGETESQFMNTFDLLTELKMDVAHLARYSPRTGTFSARFLEDNVTDQEKKHRFRMLEDLQEKISTEINQKYLDNQTKVLFEGKSKTRWRGRTTTNKLVFVESQESLLGQERDIRITWTGPWSMLGELS